VGSWEQIVKEASSDARVEAMEPVPGSSGPPTSYYHNPRTGQEFPGLPLDGWSLMRYMRRGLLPGRAPKELRDRFLEEQRNAPRPEFAPEVMVEAATMNAQEQGRAQSSSSNLEALVLALQKQVSDLTNKLTGGQQQELVPVEESIEPVQLKLL